MASIDVRSEGIVLLLFIHCWLLLPLFAEESVRSVFDLSVSYLVIEPTH